MITHFYMENEAQKINTSDSRSYRGLCMVGSFAWMEENV